MARLTAPIMRSLKHLILKLKIGRVRLLLRLGQRTYPLALANQLYERHPKSYDAALVVARAAVANLDFLTAATAIMTCRNLDAERLLQESLPGGCWMAPILAIIELCSKENGASELGVWHDPVPPIADRRSRGRRFLEIIHVPMPQPTVSVGTDEGISMDEVASVDWDLLLDQLAPPESP